MTKIVILGAGRMGSAFSFPLAENGHSIELVGTHLDEEIIAQLRGGGVHPGLGTQLPSNVQLKTYDELESALVGADLLVLAVTALGIDWVGMVLMMLDNGFPPNLPILFLTKGMEGKNDGNHWFSKNERLRVLPDTLREALMEPQAEQIPMMVMGGPCRAEELVTHQQTSAIIAGSDEPLLEQIAAMLRTPTYHVGTSTDLLGIQLCGALKDLYALAIGLVSDSDGSQDSNPGAATSQIKNHNPAAAIFAQGLQETTYLIELLGGDPKTVLTVAGAGDFYAAALDKQHLQLGKLLGQGMRYADAKQEHMPDGLIEGAEVALAIGRTVEYLLQADELDSSRLPLLRMLIGVVCSDKVVEMPWDQFGR